MYKVDNESNGASFSGPECRGCKSQVVEGRKEKRGSAACGQELRYPGRGRREVHQGRVWCLTSDP